MMKNYPKQFEQEKFFASSIFHTFYGLEHDLYSTEHQHKLDLLDSCLKDYYQSADKLSLADKELLEEIKMMLLMEWSPKYKSYNDLYDIRIMEVCKIYLKMMDNVDDKILYIKHAAEYAQLLEDKVDPLADPATMRYPAALLRHGLELFETLPESKRAKQEKNRNDIQQGIEKLEHFDKLMETLRKRHKEEVSQFMRGREVQKGDDVIKWYVEGDASGRMEWIRYFYTECTDRRVIEKHCEKLFGGYNEDDAEGYVGAYTLLQVVSKYSAAYWAGFNYSFEQMSANYD